MPEVTTIAMDVQACMRGPEISIHQMTVGPRSASESRLQNIQLHFNASYRKLPVQISAKIFPHDVPQRLMTRQTETNSMMSPGRPINLCARRRPLVAWPVLRGLKGYQVYRAGQHQTNYELERLWTGAIIRDA